MALIYQVLRVLVLGVTAAAFDDVPITWSQNPRSASLPCVVVDWNRPPPLIDDDRSKAKVYTWRKLGSDDHINSKRISLNGSLEVIRKSGGGSEGVYQCMVLEQVLGYPVHLKFSYIDKQFAAQPKNATARIGQPFSIPCRIGSGPPAVVTWTRDGRNLPKNNRYHFFESELLITDVVKEDAGSYRCVATNSKANRTRTSKEGRVTVQESVEEEPSLLSVQHEENFAVLRGSRVLLFCPVLGWPRPNLLWKFTAPGERTSELEETQEILELSKLEYDQEGIYECSVEGHRNLTKSFIVTIIEPVRITLPPVSKEAMRASTVRFNCTATGRPEPEVTWYKNGKPLGRSNVRQSADRKRMELIVGGVDSADAGVYQCFARNAHGVTSSWARLGVTGPGAEAPHELHCAPAGAALVALRWSPTSGRLVAYTVDVTITDKSSPPITGQPHQNTEEVVKVGEALKPYTFQVRVYISSPTDNKSIASDMSESVVCQGQGVPIKLTKLGEDTVLVSWQQFSEENPGVVQWILQYKNKNGSHDEVHNVTLAAEVTNYTLTAPPSAPLLVRLLGSRTQDWLPQNLTLVPWASTTTVGHDIDDGVVNVVAEDLQVTDLGETWFTVQWKCEDPSRYNFLVCVKEAVDFECHESSTTTKKIEGLKPDTNYEVQVQVLIPGQIRGGAFSAPLPVTTQSEGWQRLKEVKYEWVNTSTLRVSWSGSPARYTVRHSAQLLLPVELWASTDTSDNCVLITGIEPTQQTFVMVTGYEPLTHSPILTVPAPMKELEVKDLNYAYTSTGVSVWWSDAGPRTVRFAQNITQPLDSWATINVTEPRVELTQLEPSLPLYVMVTLGSARRQPVLTVPPRPQTESNNLYLYIGVSVACLFAVAALVSNAYCAWKRYKSPRRSHRRAVATAEGAEEEGSEMKTARVANGGAAGEPLLNGHVHVTENPASKTPNGRMKKGHIEQAYEAFDVSRNDNETTAETVLDDTSYSLLDTSRRPDYDLERSSHNLSVNNSFNKLPDDNMNSELTRSSVIQLDNSKIHPTLQPNG